MINIIDNSIIKLTRGDTALISLAIYESDGETPYTPVAGDHIIFTIKPDINNEYYVLKKEFNESLKLPIVKSDTIDLNFGSYFFDIRLENGNEFDTILCNGQFIIERGTANNARS